MEDIWQNFAMEYRAKHVVWRGDFQFFEDRSVAINHDPGVNDQLASMIKGWWNPGQKIAVGNPKYKTIIEASLGISCLHEECVMEVMEGLKNLMYSLVPEEKSELSKEDCLQMSQGLKMLVNRYGFDVKPEMVNDRILETACYLYDCDDCEKKHSRSLRRAGRSVKHISGIKTEWDLLKLSTALTIICYPGEKVVDFNSQEMFSTDELSKLVADAHKYEGWILKGTTSRIYKEMAFAHQLRIEKQKLLGSLIEEARKVYP